MVRHTCYLIAAALLQRLVSAQFLAQNSAPPSADELADIEFKKLAQAQFKHYERGCWMYGDMQDVVVEDGLGCGKACESEPECYHWTYHLTNGRCMLKALGGNLNEDQSDWIS